jgi:ferredoxin
MIEQVRIGAEDFPHLLEALRRRGYQVIGPTVRDGAITYDTITSCADLPRGWTDEHAAGRYRLVPRDDTAYFGYVVGPHSWKHLLHPARLRLWRAQRHDDGFQILDDVQEVPKYAFLGVRGCELHALGTHDTVLMDGTYVDTTYAARRAQVFLVAVNCAQAGGTCFCVSMQAGPHVPAGFDLVLTEVVDATTHHFVVEVGSERGAEVMRDVPQRRASEAEVQAAKAIVDHTAAHMGRTLDTADIKELLYQNLEHPRWDAVASRCLACANCTMVCPTCFCTTVNEVTDLTGAHAARWRTWDSCFTQDFTYIHGGSVRSSTKSRYRHWLTHKLATWIDQFGSSGCVGCGRCITWCPVGIDLTEEVQALRESPRTATTIPRSPGVGA